MDHAPGTVVAPAAVPHEAAPRQDAASLPRHSWHVHVLPLSLYALSLAWLAVFTLPHYMWAGHESLFPVVRVRIMADLWRAGGGFQAPWMADQCFGYGWPFFTFYSPLGYWVGAALSFLPGVDLGHATQASFGLSVFLGGLFMYALVVTLGRERDWPRRCLWAGAIATVYSLTPYHLADVFSRGSLAESWGWTWLPLLLLGAETCRRSPRRGLLVVAIATSALVLSHNITALYGPILTACYILGQSRNFRWPLFVLAGGLWGALLAAFFWYPAMRLLPLVSANGMAYSTEVLHKHCLYWQQYLVETPGRGLSIDGPGDQLGINLGLAILLGSLLSLWALVARRLPRGSRWPVAWSLGLLLALLFVMSPQMNWSHVPNALHFVQFPWRLLVFAVLCGCLATAHAIPALDGWLHPTVFAALAVVLTLSAPRTIMSFDSKFASDADLEKFGARQESPRDFLAGCEAHEYLPRAVPFHYADSAWQHSHPAPDNRLTVLEGTAAVNAYEHRGAAYRYAYEAAGDAAARIHVFDFPGWRLRLDGIDRPDLRRPDSDGLVGVALPAGSHELRLDYTISPAGRHARRVSAAAWAAWLAVAAWPAVARRRRRPHSGPV